MPSLIGRCGGSAGGGFEVEVAYYEIAGIASGSLPGTVAYTMTLVSTSSPSTFDTSSGYARMSQSGAYQAYAFLDMETTTTFTAGAITNVRFGLDFPFFPMYTVGGPWKTLPVGPVSGGTTLVLWDLELGGEWVVDLADAPAGPRSCRLFLQAPSVSPSTPTLGYLVLKRVRPLDWTF